MNRRTRLISAGAAIVAALLAPLVIAAPASALTAGDQVLFYTNDPFTDVDEEDLNMIAALEASGATVTQFDGGDGTLVTWSAALTASIDVFVIPENSGLWGSLTSDVQDYIADWVAGGGTLVLGAIANEDDTVSGVTGLDYTSVRSTGSNAPYALQIVDPTLPTELQYADGTYPIDTGSWAPEYLAVFTEIYSNGAVVAVGVWSVGSGSIIGFGWDWFPNSGDVSSGVAGDWNDVLETLAVARAEEPEDPTLAATGGELLPIGAVALTLLLGGGAIMALRRRTQLASAVS